MSEPEEREIHLKGIDSERHIERKSVVDDAEMNEILGFEKDIKKGLSNVSAGRYRVIG